MFELTIEQRKQLLQYLWTRPYGEVATIIAMLVSLKDEFIFSLTVPSKVQCYMASKKPILGMLNGAGNDIIYKSQSGFVSNAGDFHRLAKYAMKFESLSKKDKELLGQNSFNYYQKYFKKNKIIDSFIQNLG